MSGEIFRLAKRDARHFVTAGGFQEDITLSTPDKSVSISLTGFATKHHINFDEGGNPINSKNAHISISEIFLLENGYPVRNAKKEIALKNHLVSFPDSSGELKHYVVNENFPDETIGIICLILGDYNPG